MAGRTSLLFSLIVAVYFCGTAAQIRECKNATVADIVFLVDGSSSIGTINFQEIRTFLRNIVKALNIGRDNIRIGLAQYNDKPHKEFLLKDHMDKTSLLAAVERIPYRTGNTYTGMAMEFLLKEYFTQQAGSRKGQRVPQIAVVLTDGESADKVDAPAQHLRQHGVIVFGIGVGDVNRTELETIANWPPERFLHTIDSYQALQRLTNRLLETVCDSVEYQWEALVDRYADIFFLVDSGIPQRQLMTFRGELNKLINQLSVSESTYRVGLAQYGETTTADFFLNTYKTKQETQNAVKRFRLRSQPNQQRNLGSALQYAKSHFFTKEAGGRADQGARQYLVVVSGKDSDDPVSQDAQTIKSLGVSLIGMSAGAGMTALDVFDYTFPDFKVLVLKDIIMTEVKENTTGDCKGVNLADIVFIIDESGSIGSSNFMLIRRFLHSVVSSLDIDKSRVRVGIVTYNSATTTQAFLDTFNHKAEVLQFIKLLPYRGGGTNTGAALNYTLKNVFITEKGSRKDKNITQVAVVITDGQSDDSVSDAAISLRRAGVTIYCVGVENAVEKELKTMASYPSDRHVFNVKSFTELRPLTQSLQKILCENIIEGDINVLTSEQDTKRACIQKDEADIYFLMDDSGSIGNQDFREMKDFIIKFLKTFRIGQDHIRVGLVKYSDNPHEQFDVKDYSDVQSLVNAVEKISHDGGGTETGKALSSMGQRFRRSPRDHSVPEYLIVITDGESTDDVSAPAAALKAQGIIIYAIGVKESKEAELKQIASDPKKAIFVNNFDALQLINKDIIIDICAEDVCKDVQGDIFFLTDSSESISENDFKAMKEFMKSVISKTDIGQSKVHVGVMQFSTNYQLEFALDEYYSVDNITNAIDGMQQMNEGTLTGKAITEVSQYFDKNRGGRPELTQRLIVITDGEAKDKVAGPAEALRKKGVVIYAIGVMTANVTQLLEISGSSERVYSEKNFDGLKDLESKVALEICKEKCVIKQADVIFLVDSSKSIDSAEYQSMRRFMEKIVDHTTVGKKLTQFGLISYSDNPMLHFTLDTFDTNRKVLDAIPKSKPPQGDTYTGKALDYSLQYFGAEHGGRKGVPQILMVITDGEATNPYNLKGPSDKLRQNGIIVLSIGVKEAKEDELLTMAGNDKSKVFYVQDFAALEAEYKKIATILCNTTKPDCKVADLVFLLDRSSSINPDEHNIMKTFTTDLLRKFDVRENAVHVGLAQFSTQPKHEFYLKDYLQRERMFAQIKKLNYTGGDTYLAEALDHIREYFEASHGSRSGVPKNLVMITDGGAHDMDRVEDMADILRDMNIDMFAIGVGDVHTLPLLQITGDPERLFTVRNFNGLTHIKQRVIDEMCDEPFKPTTAPPTVTPFPLTSTPTPVTPSTTATPTAKPQKLCTIDIAIGFDISQRTGAPDEKLISGHTKLKTFLPQIVHYVSSVKGLCCFAPTIKTKIAFQVVDVKGSSLYDTNFEEYNEDVVNKVMGLRISEPTYFNSAMLNFFKKRFKAKSKALVKVLVIFSDGLDEDTMTLESESDKLRESGINALLTVALEGARHPDKLQMVEFGRGFGYKLPLSIGMPSVGSTILKQIDAVADRICCDVTCKCSGHEGIPGFPGKPGQKGVPGQKGQPGFPGEEGVAGDRGPPGPSGPPGIEGCPGPRGQKGFRGGSGDRGEDGEDGVEGINGEQGVTGLDGARGQKGDPGNPGNTGIRGEAGQKGERGLRGDPGERGADNNKPGPKGEPGNPGLPGLPGLDGLPGEGGEIGNPGPDGRRGSPGGKGLPGDAGDPGLPGSPGAAGPQGRRGGTGDRGPKGINGSPGPQGPQGPPGNKGAAGRRGPNGQKGQPGEPGVKGAPGSEGPRGMPGEDGRDGYGPQGSKGVKGDPGFPGYPGLVGEDGQKGTVGYPGRKGNQGRGGNAGWTGDPGPPGDKGHKGRRGPKGPPGERESECKLVTYIRGNCQCCTDNECPAYPTELVFGLDMSQDVTETDFNNQRKALVSLLEDINISESNCPNGARVAVVGYNTSVTYLIRFQDYHRKKKLIESVKNLRWEAASEQRNLGAAMRFVGHNLFKRIRAGVMMRKVAVFFSNGPSQDSSEIVTAMMEYRALNIVPVVISLNEAQPVERAMEVDDTRNFVYADLKRDIAKVKDCAICYDPCRPSELCSFIQEVPAPQEVNMDLVMVLDSSREMQADEYGGAQQLLGSVVQQLVVSPQPRRAGNQARVALIQQSGTRKPKVEFGLLTYQNHNQMRRHLLRNMTQQGGSSALGHTLEFTLRDVLPKTGQPRRRRAVLTVVGTRTASEDQARLRYISQKAKCEGVALFVVTVGDRYDQAQVEELAGLPVEQHLIHLGRLRPDEQDYAQRFFRVFLTSLKLGTNVYPPPSLRQTCSQLREPQEALVFENGQGSAELQMDFMEDFEEQRGGRTQSRHLDVVETLTREDSQTALSGAEVNEPVILPAPETTTLVPQDPCLLSRDTGGCQNYTIMWFFDSNKSRCSRFWYGGCDGNENRFKTQEDCVKRCLTRKRLRRGEAAKRFSGNRRSG